jgi:lipopolysaccharide heptosyltransferase I
MTRTAALPISPRRVLIIKPSAIGDVVHTLPVLNVVRQRWPDAYIAWLVTPACADLLDGQPQLNEVIRFERRRFGKGWHNPSAAVGLFRFARELRAKQFDLVIDLQGLFRSGWLSWQTRAPYRVGFTSAREFAWAFYTHRVMIADAEQHAIDRYLTLAESIGCGRGPVEFRFATNDADRRVVSELLRDDSPYAVLLPGTNWPTKRWPVEHFAATVAPLRKRFGLRSVIAGGPTDRALAAMIPDALDLTGKTTLRQTVALLERTSVVVANDSGPMHTAAALRRPLVTPYGPTSPVRTGPYRRLDTVVRLDIPCSPCFSRQCSHQSCLRWLTPEHVLREVERQLAPITSAT